MIGEDTGPRGGEAFGDGRVPTTEAKNTSCMYLKQKGKKGSSNVRYKFWAHENHPVLLDSTEMYNQRLNYLHWNPVTAGLVAEPWHWIYSSATDYFKEKKGLPDIIILDGF